VADPPHHTRVIMHRGASASRLRYHSFTDQDRHTEDTDMAPAIAPPARLSDVTPGGSAV
jgi:hypothetical protein